MIVVNARFLTQNLTGVQRFSLELSLRLKGLLDKEIVFLTPRNIVQAEYSEKLDAVVVGKHTGHLWEQYDLPKWLNKNGKPLLLCMGNTAPVLYGNKMTVLHDVTFLHYPEAYSKLFLLFYKVMVPLVLRTSKHVFTVSKFSEEDIISSYGLDAGKISVVYNAVSSKFHPVVDDKLKEEKYLLAVSSVKTSKNFTTAVEAFIKSQRDMPELKLYIVGDIMSGSFKAMPELVSLCKNHPGIRLLGRVSDEELIRYYSNALAFIFPSYYEGFGIPVLEAQACGCPVISSNSSSLPEVLGESALLCDPHNVYDFVDAIKIIAEDKNQRKSFISLGGANVKRFDWSKSAKALLASLTE